MLISVIANHIVLVPKFFDKFAFFIHFVNLDVQIRDGMNSLIIVRQAMLNYCLKQN